MASAPTCCPKVFSFTKASLRTVCTCCTVVMTELKRVTGSDFVTLSKLIKEQKKKLFLMCSYISSSINDACHGYKTVLRFLFFLFFLFSPHLFSVVADLLYRSVPLSSVHSPLFSSMSSTLPPALLHSGASPLSSVSSLKTEGKAGFGGRGDKVVVVLMGDEEKGVKNGVPRMSTPTHVHI